MAAYRQRERDTLLQLQREVFIPMFGAERASMADTEREAMPKPRGFNGCCIAAFASIATVASHPSLLLNIERGRYTKRDRGRFLKRE
ncbi:hypothetical protein AMTRI_Chr06g174740 [Amborella trichopoda]